MYASGVVVRQEMDDTQEFVSVDEIAKEIRRRLKAHSASDSSARSMADRSTEARGLIKLADIANRGVLSKDGGTLTQRLPTQGRAISTARNGIVRGILPKRFIQAMI